MARVFPASSFVFVPSSLYQLSSIPTEAFDRRLVVCSLMSTPPRLLCESPFLFYFRILSYLVQV